MIYNPTPEEWQTVYDKSPIGIAFVDPDGRWTKVNQKLCKILQYTEDELYKMKFQDVTHPADLHADLQSLEKLSHNEIDYYEMYKRYITKTGKSVWIRLTVWPVKDADKIIHYVSHIEPLLNGNASNSKVERDGNNINVRPTLTIGEFIADNWKAFIAVLGVIISSMTVAGVAYWGMIEKVNRLDQINTHQQEIIKEFIKDATTKTGP